MAIATHEAGTAEVVDAGESCRAAWPHVGQLMEHISGRRAVALPPPVDDVRRTELPHGLRVLTDSVPGSNAATLAVWVGVGGRDETEEHSGASHFLEHLLFKGTERRSARDLAAGIDEVGGDMNAYTSSEYTSFYARVPAVEIDTALDMLLDVVAAPALRAEEFDAEREVILEELAAAEDDPEDVVGVRLFEALFPGHPLGREVLGTSMSISGMTRDDVAAFFGNFYRPCNLVVTCAGAVDHDRLAEQVAIRLDNDPVGERPLRSSPGQAVSAVIIEHDPGELVHMSWGWRTAGARDEDRYALAVLNHVLGAGPSSRLFQTVREEHGLTYSIGSAVSQYTDAGVLSVACATTPSKALRVVDLVHGELARLAGGGVSAEELARAQRSMPRIVAARVGGHEHPRCTPRSLRDPARTGELAAGTSGLRRRDRSRCRRFARPSDLRRRRGPLDRGSGRPGRPGGRPDLTG
ncbi:MAG: pitrilysin family protein [Microthrixaceae bacterium]